MEAPPVPPGPGDERHSVTANHTLGEELGKDSTTDFPALNGTSDKIRSPTANQGLKKGAWVTAVQQAQKGLKNMM